MEMENLKATELTLGLPGRREESHECKNNKRSSSEMDNGSSQTQQSPPKAQVVGWPPVRSYRKKAVHRSESEGSGFVKVSMDGAPYLRKIELKFYKNYFDLVKGLEGMFKCNIGSELAPTYEDKDGDWMLVGDVPWDMFIASCKRLRLMKGGGSV